MELSVFVGGTAASVPTATRGLSSYMLRAGGKRILIDCGEGTQHQFARSIGLPEIDAIFITHLHLDHWFGLVGILKTFDLRDRDRPLAVYGPPYLEDRIKAMTGILGRTGYPLEIRQLEEFEAVPFDEFVIHSFPVEHRTQAYGYRFEEATRRGRVDMERAKHFGIEGPDIGALLRGETVNGIDALSVIGPPRPGRCVVFSGDTAPCANTRNAAYQADLLIHEATFGDDEQARAKKTGHSTARQAAELAAESGAKRLVLTHVSAREHWKTLLQQAKEAYVGPVKIAADFDEYEIPYSD